MVLSADLIKQFVKATKDTETKKTETIVYGTAKDQNGTMFVQFDGSALMTPVISTADTKDGDRVTVMIKNHTAIITGNVSSPSARTDDVKDIKADVDVDLTGIKKQLSNQSNAVSAQSVLITEHERYLTSLDLRVDSQGATVKDIKTVVDMLTSVAEKHDIDVGELVDFLYGEITKLDAKVKEATDTAVYNLTERIDTVETNNSAGLLTLVDDYTNKINNIGIKHDNDISDLVDKIGRISDHVGLDLNT